MSIIEDQDHLRKPHRRQAQIRFLAADLIYMRAFAEAWPDRAIVQPSVSQLPWGQNVQLLDSLKTLALREWYARKAMEYGWSRSVLAIHIESGLFWT